MNILSVIGPLQSLIILVIVVLPIICMWILFEKAQKPGWAVLLPIYNLLVFMEIIGKPWWWVLLWLIPFLNFIWIIWSINLFVKRFGDGIGGTITFLFIPFIYLPMLAFDKNVIYKGSNSN
jgi:hypothetical protein